MTKVRMFSILFVFFGDGSERLCPFTTFMHVIIESTFCWSLFLNKLFLLLFCVLCTVNLMFDGRKMSGYDISAPHTTLTFVSEWNIFRCWPTNGTQFKSIKYALPHSRKNLVARVRDHVFTFQSPVPSAIRLSVRREVCASSINNNPFSSRFANFRQ